MIFCAVPVVGVKETSLIVAVNDRIFVPGGGVSGVASMVTLTEPVPVLPPPLLPCKPLQELRESAASKTRKRNNLLQFMEYPTKK